MKIQYKYILSRPTSDNPFGAYKFYSHTRAKSLQLGEATLSAPLTPLKPSRYPFLRLSRLPLKPPGYPFLRLPRNTLDTHFPDTMHTAHCFLRSSNTTWQQLNFNSPVVLFLHFWTVFRSERAISTIFPPYIITNRNYERKKCLRYPPFNDTFSEGPSLASQNPQSCQDQIKM